MGIKTVMIAIANNLASIRGRGKNLDEKVKYRMQPKKGIKIG
ncbi:MAG TPA: hypothetical protein VFM70_08395 [Salinimicrobium sp.]|nr:hypothetical protein [Salinimicrobium sp.]